MVRMPKAVNMLSSVNFKDLKLDRNEFEIMNTITAAATVHCTYSFGRQWIEITCEQDPNFSMKYQKISKKTSEYVLQKHQGVLRMGLLNNDIATISDDNFTAEYIARKMALYYLNNQINDIGADCIIEPIVTTSFEEKGNVVIYHATASGKPVKILMDKNLKK